MGISGQQEKELKASSLVHLHLHSEYSLLDGAIQLDSLIDKVKKLGHKAVALTDHANLYGAIDFYSKAKAANIKPIIGVEIYLESTSLTREYLQQAEMDMENVFHLVLLAKSLRGYKSLMRIVSSGYLSNPSGALPIVSFEYLQNHAEDLIGLSSCMKGELGFLASQLPPGNIEDTLATNPTLHAAIGQYFAVMSSIFASGDFFAELIDNGLGLQSKTLPKIVALADLYQIPLVASCDAHYLNHEDQEAHGVLTAIKNDLTQSSLRDQLKHTHFHLLDNQEFSDLFQHWPQALANTGIIADRCDIELKFGQYFLPNFELEGDQDEARALASLSRQGLEERIAQQKTIEGRQFSDSDIALYNQRLNYELEVIVSMGFPGYFLIVQDFINWAKNQEIPVGPGRGSGAGSLVAYSLKVTDLDPIRLNLIFERFLNPERVSMPDFDVDFCQDRRDEVIKYVTEKYGNANVAQITTFGKMKAKAAIRDVGRVLEIGYGRVDKIAKLIPNELDIKLQEAIDKEPRLQQEADQDDRIASLLNLALQIEGINRHTSVHAAGLVISQGGMENYVPVYTNEDGCLITQYEMKNAEKVGLVKFDFLGLKTLTVIDKAVAIIRQRHQSDFAIESIDLEAKKVYEQISQAHSVGVFQLESTGMQALLTKLQPSRFEDIIAVVALFRPGPLGSGMVDDFIERKHGRQKITYPHPKLDSILNDTYGIILYQEQVQKIAAELANYSLGEADLLRRAMGKKKPEEMAKQKTRFIDGCQKNDIAQKVAEELFELMAKFAAYGFNKSHSAAYGLISYQTAYLKAFFPEEYMAAIMTCDMDNTDKLSRYIEECRRMNFKILPPDINRSTLHFDVPTQKQVGFALGAIKGLGANSITPIIKERAQGKFQSLTDLATRVNLQKIGKKTLELLTQTGALDCFHSHRPAIFQKISEMMKFSENHHTAAESGQQLLFAVEDSWNTEPEISEWELQLRNAKLASNQLEWLLKEKKYLGVFLSYHPLGFYQNDRQKFGNTTLGDLKKYLGQKITLLAFLDGIKERFTKSGKKMAYIQIQDETGSMEAVMFAKDLTNDLPPENSVVAVSGLVKESYDRTSLGFQVSQVISLESKRRQEIKKANIIIQSTRKATTNELEETKKTIEHIMQLIQTYPGSTAISLMLVFPEGKIPVKIPPKNIDLSDQVLQEFAKLKQTGASIIY